MTSYLFRNKDTGEIRRGVSFSLASAARRAGIDVPYRQKLPEPWMPWECWQSPTECIWHVVDDGTKEADFVAGPRPE
jgi:hypothetical protein